MIRALFLFFLLSVFCSFFSFRFYIFINLLGKQKQRQPSGNKKQIFYMCICTVIKQKKKKKLNQNQNQSQSLNSHHIAADVNAWGGGGSIGKRLKGVVRTLASCEQAAQTGGVAINIIEL